MYYARLCMYQVLSAVVNAISPGIIPRVHQPTGPLAKDRARLNLASVVRACKLLGIRFDIAESALALLEDTVRFHCSILLTLNSELS